MSTLLEKLGTNIFELPSPEKRVKIEMENENTEVSVVCYGDSDWILSLEQIRPELSRKEFKNIMEENGLETNGCYLKKLTDTTPLTMMYRSREEGGFLRANMMYLRKVSVPQSVAKKEYKKCLEDLIGIIEQIENYE